MATFETVLLKKYAAQTQHALNVWRFGRGAPEAPKVYVHAGMHADELPANLVAAKLARLLKEADGRGEVAGSVTVVPVANPIGFNNVNLRTHNGRYHMASGENYNRGFPDVSDDVLNSLGDAVTADGRENAEALKAYVSAALERVSPANEAQALRLELMKIAADADIVLDLHTDSEAEMHLYLDEDHWPGATDLAACLDAKVVMFARGSGGGPFEETMAWPYVRARKKFGEDRFDLPLTVVVELRGEHDTDHDFTDRDAAGLLDFLCHRGVVEAKPSRSLPEFKGVAGPFTATEMLKANAPGVIVYLKPLGATVEEGDVVAEIIDPGSEGEMVADRVIAPASGRFFARANQRLAWPGENIGKIQCPEALAHRQGKLLHD